MQLLYLCSDCSKFYTLHKGDLAGIPFNRLPKLVLEADTHACPKKKQVA